ncbi:hypothetical protein MPNT_20089 [Candidatus Methylacidithermus pantelleriae]|uniref:Uncharacterized protein n=1 Tax=Candidatus Methylacidithermus pantelleriae TaxID=2744239 RepID=A0A8J2BHV9_9BACT|nr:hypothetical protein MPNT_20089 [Candidatus Methylacidithermus pantelleriae]
MGSSWLFKVIALGSGKKWLVRACVLAKALSALQKLRQLSQNGMKRCGNYALRFLLRRGPVSCGAYA